MGCTNYGFVNVSHLLFAYDTLLVCVTDHGHVQSLRALLLCFQVVSVFEPRGLQDGPDGCSADIRVLTSILSCKVVAVPMKYQGLPLGPAFGKRLSWMMWLRRLREGW